MDKQGSLKFQRSFYAPRYWSTWLALGLLYTLARLPLSISTFIGRLLGDLLFYVARSRRRICEINIALCFPQLSPAQQRALVRKTIRSTGLSMVESAIALWGPPQRLKQHYTISGLEHIEAALAQGKGVLLVGCHFTTLDVAARLMADHVKVDLLYRKHPNDLLDYKISSARESFSGTTIPRTDTRQLIKNLRKGHVIWYAPDQDYGAKYSVFAPFFGIQTSTITATARIAAMGGAVVIPFAHYREEDNHYHLQVEPPLENYPTGDDVADATRINQFIEAAVAKHPEQYLWVHRRFKTRPEGEASFYPQKKRKKRRTPN